MLAGHFGTELQTVDEAFSMDAVSLRRTPAILCNDSKKKHSLPLSDFGMDFGGGAVVPCLKL